MSNVVPKEKGSQGNVPGVRGSVNLRSYEGTPQSNPVGRGQF